MRWLFAAAVAALLLPSVAWAQNTSTCPAYSRKAILHPTGETSYTLLPTDECALLVFQNTGAETVTLPVPNQLFPAGWTVKMFALGAGGLTLSAATGTQINNASSISKTQTNGADLYIGQSKWWAKP